MSTRRKNTGAGVAVGIALGVAFGAAFDQLGLGLALGVAIGAAFEWRPRGEPSPDGEDANPKNMPISDPDRPDSGSGDFSGGDE
ncbi:hypothetical protein [Maricaulis sp.]|uniref:hypothetical protein n=1 Tax=Maricaulis sp. TaxID=1486257 RepID=UPI002B270D1B|nr:hypothetical protein [Maricaulis sp.]